MKGSFLMFEVITNKNGSVHRLALYNSINKLNGKYSTQDLAYRKVCVVVGIKNIITQIPKIILLDNFYFLHLTGFGRIYTDYGFSGQYFFKLTLKLLSLAKNLEIIVENESDKVYVQQVTKMQPFKISGSGVVTQLLPKLESYTEKQLVFGYMSMFGKSKHTDKIFKLCEQAPQNMKFVIAGHDIFGSKYSKKFAKLAEEKNNIVFIGALNRGFEISDFFNQISILLMPSKREGLCMTLLESIFYQRPFITTSVPGCDELAKEMDYPTLEATEFRDPKNILKIAKKIGKGQNRMFSQNILNKYTSEIVEKQFDVIFHRTLKKNN